MTQLTDGLRLALSQLEEMVQSYQTPHPKPNWLQHLIWQDADRELALAGFSEGSIAEALDVYDAEREAARLQPTAAFTRGEIDGRSHHQVECLQR